MYGEEIENERMERKDEIEEGVVRQMMSRFFLFHDAKQNSA
jgi:hypothetical protein